MLQDEYFCGYKQAYRREDDIATVNAGIRVQFEENSNVIKEMAFGYGGMAPITVMATKTAASMVGKWEIISVLDHNSVTKVIKKYHILTELLHLLKESR